MTAGRAGSGVPMALPCGHRVLLATIVAVGLARGLFWVGTLEVWSPLDEAQHFAYVESLARGHGVPVLGRDHVSGEVLEVALASPTGPWSSHPLLPVAADERWGAMREQYEASQPPLYYALMVGPYLLGRGAGLLHAVFAVRVATVFVSLLAVAVAYLLARELLPRQPAAWLLAPALLVVVQGFNANLATATNDALVPATAAALIPALRALRSGSTRGRVVATGVLLGLGLLAKATAAAIVLVVVAGAVAAVLAGQATWRRVGAFLAGSGTVAAAVCTPWAMWNVLTYGSLAPGEAVLAAVTGPLQEAVPLSVAGVAQHLERALWGYWEGQAVTASRYGPYVVVLSLVAVLAVAAGLALRPRDPGAPARATFAWLAAALPLAAVTTLAIAYAALGGALFTVGRLLYASLVPLVVLVAGVAVATLGTRRGTLALLGVAAVALTLEVGLVDRYVAGTYVTGNLAGGLTPVVDQTRNDAWIDDVTVVLTPPCPVEAMALTFLGDVPAEVHARGDSHADPLPLYRADRTRGGPNVAVYRLKQPTTAPFEVAVPPGYLVGHRASDTEPSVGLAGFPSDVVARLYCHSATPEAHRFAQVHGANHPQVGLATVRAWPRAWATAAWLALASLGIRWRIRGGWRRRP